MKTQLTISVLSIFLFSGAAQAAGACFSAPNCQGGVISWIASYGDCLQSGGNSWKAGNLCRSRGSTASQIPLGRSSSHPRSMP